jgi:hypothetical protein
LQTKRAVTGQFIASGQDDRLRSEPHPKSKWRVLLASLRRGWGYSSARQAAIELRNFPLRISAILRISEMGFGPTIPPSPSGQRQTNLYPPSTFVLACIAGIEELQRANPWMGHLELQTAAQAFQLGARWALDSQHLDNGKHNAVRSWSTSGCVADGNLGAGRDA